MYLLLCLSSIMLIIIYIIKQDEVLHILNNLDPNVLFDLSKTFAKQKKSINKKLLPAVKSAMNPSMKNVYDSEIIKVIKQLHKSRRDVWKKEKDGKKNEHLKRQHVAARRDQVCKLYYISIYKLFKILFL